VQGPEFKPQPKREEEEKEEKKQREAVDTGAWERLWSPA
jgi:hypothetical protein